MKVLEERWLGGCGGWNSCGGDQWSVVLMVSSVGGVGGGVGGGVRWSVVVYTFDLMLLLLLLLLLLLPVHMWYVS